MRALLSVAAVLFLFGALIIAMGEIGPPSQYKPGHRFKEDNAVGATANAVEAALEKSSSRAMQYVIAAILCVIGAFVVDLGARVSFAHGDIANLIRNDRNKSVPPPPPSLKDKLLD